MNRSSAWLRREEKLALLCTFGLTSLLSAYVFHLNEEESEERSPSVLFEYQEVAPHPVIARRSTGETVSDTQKGIHAARLRKVHGGPVDTAMRAHSVASDSVLPPNKTSISSTPAIQSVVFRSAERSTEVDSILAMDPRIGELMLRSYIIEASRAYDTAQTTHLIRLANGFTRFNREFTLEEVMRRDMQRFGYPYHPMRPQPPSAQVPVLPIILPVLDFISSAVKGIPSALSRAVRPGKKKPAE